MGWEIRLRGMLCISTSKCLLLQNGNITNFGETNKVIDAYFSKHSEIKYTYTSENANSIIKKNLQMAALFRRSMTTCISRSLHTAIAPFARLEIADDENLNSNTYVSQMQGSGG